MGQMTLLKILFSMTRTNFTNLYLLYKKTQFQMPILKAFLESKNLSTSGRKQDLVERVEGWFER